MAVSSAESGASGELGSQKRRVNSSSRISRQSSNSIPSNMKAETPKAKGGSMDWSERSNKDQNAAASVQAEPKATPTVPILSGGREDAPRSVDDGLLVKDVFKRVAGRAQRVKVENRSFIERVSSSQEPKCQTKKAPLQQPVSRPRTAAPVLAPSSCPAPTKRSGSARVGSKSVDISAINRGSHHVSKTKDGLYSEELRDSFDINKSFKYDLFARGEPVDPPFGRLVKQFEQAARQFGKDLMKATENDLERHAAREIGGREICSVLEKDKNVSDSIRNRAHISKWRMEDKSKQMWKKGIDMVVIRNKHERYTRAILHAEKAPQVDSAKERPPTDTNSRALPSGTPRTSVDREYIPYDPESTQQGTTAFVPPNESTHPIVKVGNWLVQNSFEDAPVSQRSRASDDKRSSQSGNMSTRSRMSGQTPSAGHDSEKASVDGSGYNVGMAIRGLDKGEEQKLDLLNLPNHSMEERLLLQYVRDVRSKSRPEPPMSFTSGSTHTQLSRHSGGHSNRDSKAEKNKENISESVRGSASSSKSSRRATKPRSSSGYEALGQYPKLDMKTNGDPYYF